MGAGLPAEPRFAALSRPRRARVHLQRHATHDPARRLQPPAHPL